jgi:hypothetical protein
MPRSSRSQFSRSTTQTVDRHAVPQTLKEVEDLYPKFDDDLRLVAGESDMSAKLAPSQQYRELVYKSSKIDLAKDMKTSFALTIWYEGVDNRDRPALAEISFSYDTTDGAVPAEAARRGPGLFLASKIWTGRIPVNLPRPHWPAVPAEVGKGVHLLDLPPNPNGAAGAARWGACCARARDSRRGSQLRRGRVWTPAARLPLTICRGRRAFLPLCGNRAFR